MLSKDFTVRKELGVKRIYFAHPINTYRTPLETLLVEKIRKLWETHELVNPSDQVHANKVLELRASDPKVNVMPYFDEVVRSCDEMVVLPFGDGMWGAGVWREAESLHAKDPSASIWVIDPQTHVVTLLLSIEDLAPLKLSVEETRARIRNPDGSSKPYE